MALPLEQQAELAANGVFIRRIEFAMITNASQVIQEAQGERVDRHQILRIDLALRVLRDSQNVARQMARFLAQVPNTTDPTEITDQAYINFITLYWSMLAGWAANDPRNRPEPEV
jgi:hypothetical protein